MKLKKTLAFLTSFLVIFILSSTLALATDPPTKETGDPPTKETSGVEIKIPNPFAHGDTIQELLKAIVDKVILPIGGVLAVLAFIYAGFLYVTAQGNTEKIKTAHRALLYAAVGTAILLGAWVISSVIENTIKQLRG